jgi:hypothetical protein
MLPARHYESEPTRFIRDLIHRKPQLIDEMRKGRAMFWDKRPADLAEERTMDEGQIPQKPYEYYHL